MKPVFATVAAFVLFGVGAVALQPAQSDQSPTPVLGVPEPATMLDLSQDKVIAEAKLSELLQIQYHSFKFDEPNGNSIASKEITVTPPPGARYVATAIAGWQLYFQTAHSSGILSRRGMGQGLVFPGVQVSGSTVKVRAHALLTDENKDDAWGGTVNVQVIFYN